MRALAEIPEAELVIAGGPERSKLRDDHAYRALIRLAAEAGVAEPPDLRRPGARR